MDLTVRLRGDKQSEIEKCENRRCWRANVYGQEQEKMRNDGVINKKYTVGNIKT